MRPKAGATDLSTSAVRWLIPVSCCLSQGLIDANEISQYAVVNQYGAAATQEAELLPTIADAFDNVTIHAAS